MKAGGGMKNGVNLNDTPGESGDTIANAPPRHFIQTEDHIAARGAEFAEHRIGPVRAYGLHIIAMSHLSCSTANNTVVCSLHDAGTHTQFQNQLGHNGRLTPN
jgi:hypothetical protein